MRAVALIVLLAGCASPTPALPRTPTPDKHEPQFRALVSAAPGRETIRGRARVLGKIRPRHGPDVKPDACATHAPLLKSRPEIRVGPDGALANVLVVAMPMGEGSPQKPPVEPAILKLHCIVMEPRVQGLVAGQRLVVRNEERVVHNFHLTARKNSEINVAFTTGSENSFTFETAEAGIKIRCDIHPWEVAWIHVFDHPYFAVTGDDGAFEIRGLPRGEYRVITWHEGFRENSIEPPVKVSDGAGANLELLFETLK